MTSDRELLAIRLRKLYTHMLALCWDLSKHSEEGKQHAEELSGAADVVHQWVEKLEEAK
jgi:hypothetical protein